MTAKTMDIAAESRGVATLSSPAAAGDTGLRPWFALLKPRVMSLVVFTGFAGMLVAPGPIHPLIAAVAVLCIAVGAGAAGAINMWYDRDIDAVMTRTAGRPLVRGLMAPAEALSFGVVLSLFSVMLMGIAVNLTAAALLAFANAFYVFVYTVWLKRRTPQNIVIGGAAGAFPPVIGWAAVTGSVDLAPLALFALIFLWTPPHFWALSLYRAGDYERAGVPMLPVVAGQRATRRQILLYTLILLPTAPLPALLGLAGWVYLGASIVLGLAFLALALSLQSDYSERRARQTFAYSILYLFLLFSLLIVDRAPGLLGGIDRGALL